MTDTKFSINDLASPYYLNPSDHVGYVISPIIVNGDYYGNWTRFYINALKSKNKFGFVKGKIRKPTTDSPKADA